MHYPAKRTIFCLCGSTRFSTAYQEANLRETLAGHIVLTIGCDMRADAALFAAMGEEERAGVKRDLDALHLDKVALADEVLVLNVGGYVGASTRREIIYALAMRKPLRWLEPERIPTPFDRYLSLESLNAYLSRVEAVLTGEAPERILQGSQAVDEHGQWYPILVRRTSPPPSGDDTAGDTSTTGTTDTTGAEEEHGHGTH